MTHGDLNPYVGPRPFERKKEDTARFFGRSQETDEIVSLIFGHPVILVYAQSGAGKTSLFNASVAPKLEENGFEVLPLTRVGGMLPKGVALQEINNLYVFNALLKMSPDTGPRTLLSLSLSAFLQTHARAIDENDQPRPRVVIFDQFEELFTYTPERWREQRDGFFLQIVEALNDDPLLRVVFVIREDFLAELDPYARNLPERLRSRYRLERLGESAALRAVRDPIADTSRKFAPGVAEALVRELLAMRTVDATGRMAEIEGQYVEPVQLQVVCVTLWSTLEPEVTEIQESHLKNFNVNEALSDFYKSAVESAARETGVPETKLRNWFGKVLVTPMGTRSTVFRSEHSTGGIPNSTVDFLESRHIIRAEIRAGARWYELTHDRLVEPILTSNQKWLDTLSPLQRQATLWNDQGKQDTWLFSDEALAEVEQWAKEHDNDLTHIEKEFLEACREHQKEIDQRKELEAQQQKLIAEQKLTRQRRIIANLSIGATVITLALAVFGFVQAGNASKQAEIAQTSLNIARTAQVDALNKQVLAKNNAETAVASEKEANRQAEISLSNSLSAQSDALLDKNFQVSLLLGIEANRRSSTVQSRGSILNGAQTNPQLRQYLNGHSSPVAAVAFSPDGSTIASIGGDNMIRFWDVEEGGPIGQQPLGSPKNTLNGFAFTTDGQLLASASSAGTIMLWDVRSGRFIDQLPTGSPISSLAFSSDGNTIVSGNFDQTLTLWDVNTLQPIGQPLSGISDTITSIAFSPDNKILASGSCFIRDRDTCTIGQVILWDLTTFQMMGQPFVGHTNFVTGISFSPDGKTLVSGSDDKTIILWDVEKRQAIGQPLNGHANSVKGVAFSPNGTTLASVGLDGTIVLWNLAARLSIGQSLIGHIDAILSIAFGPDDRYFASGSWDSTVRLWNIKNLSGEPIVLRGHEGAVSTLAFSPDGEWLATGGYDSTVHLWNIMDQSGGSIVLDGHEDAISTLAFSPDGKWLATGGYDLTARLWNIQNLSGEPIVLRGHEDAISTLAFSPDGEWLATGGYDSTIHLWSIKNLSGEPIVLRGHEDAISTLAFSPDGEWLATGGYDSTIHLWSTKNLSGEPVVLRGHEDAILTISFSPNGKWLATGSYDSTARLWNLKDPSFESTLLSGHKDAIFTLDFNPDGEWLATGSYDNTIILWDVETRQQVGQPLSGHDSAVASVVFSPDGKTLASGSYDGTIILWDMDLDSLVERSCQRVGRNLTRAEWERYFPGEEYRKTCEQWDLEPEMIPTPTPVDTQLVKATATVTPGSATATATPSATPTLAVAAGATPTPVLFRVVNVTGEDRLNIRAGPGIKYDVIGKIPKDGTGIQITGDGVQADNTIWVPIVYEGISGWVNSFYLSKQQ